MDIAIKPFDTDIKNSVPLVVDLDGTLVKSDLLYESFFDAIARHGWKILTSDFLKAPSRQGLKSHLARFSKINYAELPYDERVLQLIAEAKKEGRAVYLATASNRHHAESIAAWLGVFDGVFASDEKINLKGENKAKLLVATFGDGAFDYVGNDASDRAIWKHARTAYSVDLPAGTARQLSSAHPQHVAFEQQTSQVRALLAAMRPHQYAKNGLLFVPLLTAHQFNLDAVFSTILAFLAFSLCASGAYLLNDLIDIQADRAHPSKRKRPFASGDLPILTGAAFIPILTLSAFALAWNISTGFFVSLFVYYAITNAYSFDLKKRMIIDVVTLASLYTLRILAGATAINVEISNWLFTFSLFVFTSLALVKRYIELSTRLDKALADPSNRNYKITDLPVVMALAAAAGMNSIMVIALYVSSDDVAKLYGNPQLLWGLCPLFLYWISRALMLAHRRLMHDDPIAFALKDSRSWVVGFSSVALVMCSL